jgi:hypothetical protein
MIIMVGHMPEWWCDMCRMPIGGQAAVLYNSSNGRGHFPAPVLCCGEACERAAERQLNAGPIRRVLWDTFLAALQAQPDA